MEEIAAAFGTLAWYSEPSPKAVSDCPGFVAL